MSNLREASRKEWTSRDTGEDITQGCLQRIADATEKMAANHDSLVNERDRYKQWYEEEWKSVQRMARQIAAYRGIVRKVKKARTR